MDHYFELAKTLFCDVNPIPVKDAVNRIGYAAGPLPYAAGGRLSEANQQKMQATLEKYGLIK